MSEWNKAIQKMQSDLRAQNARNLRPHAEARLAMNIYSHEYAHEQRGGCMDFWDGLAASRKQFVIQTLDEVLESLKEHGRAALAKAAPPTLAERERK